MKLQHISEMAYKAKAFPEYTEAQMNLVVDWLSNAEELTLLEGGKFKLVVKKNADASTYAIKRTTDDTILGWVIVDLKTNKYGTQCYPLVMIFVVPTFRGTPVVLMLINALREMLDAPLYVDGAIFAAGQKLFSAVIKRNMVKASTVNKQTGEVTPYADGDLTHSDDNAFIFEQTSSGLYGCYLPGHPEVRTYFNWYEEFHEDVLK